MWLQLVSLKISQSGLENVTELNKGTRVELPNKTKHKYLKVMIWLSLICMVLRIKAVSLEKKKWLVRQESQAALIEKDQFELGMEL